MSTREHTSRTPSPPSPSSSLSNSHSTTSLDTASRSTTPSSVSPTATGCPAPSKEIFFPSSTFPDANVLSFLVKNENNDILIWLFLGPQSAHTSSEDLNVMKATQDAITSVRHAIGLGRAEVGEWIKMHVDIGGKKYYYFVSSSDNTNTTTELTTSTFPVITHSELLTTLSLVNLRTIISLPIPIAHGTLYLLEKPHISFLPLLSLSPPTTNPFTIPTLTQWRTLWHAWDTVTLQMIPQWMLHQKPIDLRHKCLFYIGHIPTFLDILLSRALGDPGTEPVKFRNIFERGIDPHVDDPNHCHNHSEVPGADEDWPSLSSILSFRDDVRARLTAIYEEAEKGGKIGRRLARTLVMCYEHEGWHIETLLYMLIQRAGTGTLPPPGSTPPPFSLLASQWNDPTIYPPPIAPTTIIGPATVTLGHDDSEADDVDSDGVERDVDPSHEFGWDNESPERKVDVGKVRIDWRPITNGDFLAFWKEHNGVAIPRSWVDVEGDILVRTLYGPVPMEVAQNWPVLTSYDDLFTYARSKGGRLPTEAELRLFFDLFEAGYEGGANVGFRNWHPVPATTGCGVNDGKGGNGGVWEWTSTVFEGHENMVPTKLFTGYSTDFFDGKHQVVIGASYATIPRLAGRRTVRNFWQHNYPYPWPDPKQLRRISYSHLRSCFVHCLAVPTNCADYRDMNLFAIPRLIRTYFGQPMTLHQEFEQPDARNNDFSPTMKRLHRESLLEDWSCDWERCHERPSFLISPNYHNLCNADMTMKSFYGLPVPIRPIAYWKTSHEHSYIFAAGEGYYFWFPEEECLLRIEGDGLTDENVILRRLSGGYTAMEEAEDGSTKLREAEHEQEALARAARI